MRQSQSLEMFLVRVRRHGRIFWTTVAACHLRSPRDFIPDNNYNSSDSDENSDGDWDKNLRLNKVTEFMSGGKLVGNSKSNDDDHDHAKATWFRGRIDSFSKSNCCDCTAVRSFFREKNLRYVKINIDVFPLKKKEFIEKTWFINATYFFQ